MATEQISKPEKNEVELTPDDLSDLIIYGEIDLDTKPFGKIKIKMLFTWN
jgi:hypothetical protein